MAGIREGKTVDILLVEDSASDIALTEEVLQEAKIANRLTVARDGLEAMQALRKTGSFADAPRPGLVLLDLNMPRKDGREVLKEVKADPDLRRIPVVVLTTSSAEEDIARSYDLHANCYITKPVDFRQFVKVVRSIEDFWLTVVKLPQRN